MTLKTMANSTVGKVCSSCKVFKVNSHFYDEKYRAWYICKNCEISNRKIATKKRNRDEKKNPPPPMFLNKEYNQNKTRVSVIIDKHYKANKEKYCKQEDK